MSTFLFQIGAIKSQYDVFTLRSQDVCFYSKLVRLKVLTYLIFYTCHVSFYSKLVRLKVRKTEKLSIKKVMFLFQIGAIKRVENDCLMKTV